MKHLLPYLLAVSVLAGLSSSLVLAGAVPQQITYQGQISFPGGAAPSNGIYIIQARIWDNATGGSVIWGQAYPVNVDTNGSFNVNLGDGGGDTKPTPQHNDLGSAMDGGPRFLGITVAQTPAGPISSPKEMAPRQQLVSGPYSLHTGMADYALTWNGRSASQLATVPAAGSSGGSSAVLGYDGTNVNSMPLTMKSNPPGLTFNGPVTLSGALLQDQNPVQVNTGFIYPKSTGGIAIGTNVNLVGTTTVRLWGYTYNEVTDGFLIVPWSWGPGGPGGSQYSRVWVTLNAYMIPSAQTVIVLYSGTTSAAASDGGYTLLPMPAGLPYRVDCGVRPTVPGTMYFQSLGQ